MSEAARSEQLALPAANRTPRDRLTLPAVAAPVDPLDGVPKKLMARAEAKAEIVAKFKARWGRSCRTLNATGALLVELYNSEREQVSAAARILYPTIEWPSLQRDWRRFEKSGIAGLVPGYRGSKRIINLNPLMREHVISRIAHNPKVTGQDVLDGIEVRFPNDRIPSLRRIEDFIRKWKQGNHSLYVRIEDPAGWKNRHMLAIGDADANITRVNQLWEIDGTPADSYVLGTVATPGGRLHVMGLIDVCSRKPTGLLVPSESSNAVEQLCIKAICLRGVPDEISHDNGAGFVSARTERGIARLGIAWPAMPAYSGWKKPFIERWFGTMLHKFFVNVPGYIGHSVIEASKIRERNGYAPGRGARRNMRRLYRIEITMYELQDLLDKWIEHVYGNKKHSGLGGRTPNEVFAEADRRGQIRRVADERLLDLLLGEDGVAVIGKKGLRAGNAFYWADELISYVGQSVQYVRTRDAGKLIVYTADAAPRFICIATNPETLGLDREVMAIAAKQRQNAVMREGVEELRKLKKKHRPETVYREIIENCAARAKVQLPASNIETLPYSSRGTDAAAAALEVLDAPAEPAPHDDEETLREGARMIEEMDRRRAAREANLSDDELWNLWKAIRRAGRALNEREQAFLSRYGNTAESWAISYESTSDYQAGLAIEKWDADEGQSHDKGDLKCA